MTAVFDHIWWCVEAKYAREFVTIPVIPRPAFGHLPVEVITTACMQNKIMVLGCQDPGTKSGRTTLLGVVPGER